MIEAVLAEARLQPKDLHALAFGRGPGAFTGVRIATAVMQGIALGTGLRLIPVSSLAALAEGCRREFNAEKVVTAINARIREVYVATFVRSVDRRWREDLGERVCTPEMVPGLEGMDWFGAGSGFSVYGERLAARLGPGLRQALPDRYPHARDIITLALDLFARGLMVAVDAALPVYLRDNIADRPAS